MTVSDLLTLNSLKGCRFVTEIEDDQATVTGVNVMEVPDIFNWVNEGELLLTVGYSYRHRPEEFADILPRLKEKGVVALGFKIHRFFDEIPPYIIASAENCGLPILEIKEDVIFSDVTKEIIGSLIQGRVEQKYQDQFYHDWMSGRINNAAELKRRAKDVCLDINSEVTYVTLLSHVGNNMGSEHIKSIIFRLNKMLGDLEGLHISFDDENIIFIVRNDLFDSQIEKIKESIRLISRREDYKLFKGKASAISFNLEESYTTALTIIKICQSYDVDKRVIEYRDVGIYALYSLIPHSKDVEDFIRMYLGNIIEYDREHGTDMLYTLKVYLESNANARLTSEKMYMHYNTIGYRLERIKQLINMDINDSDIQLCLLSAIKMYDIYL